MSSEAQHVDAEETSSGPTTRLEKIRVFLVKHAMPVVGNFKNKRILLIVIAVILLLFVFHLFGLFSGSKVSPISSQPPQAVTQTTSGNADVSLNATQDVASQSESQIQNLKSQLSDMQSSVSQLQTQNQQLQQSMQTLTTQLDNLTAQLNNALLRGKSGARRSRIVYHLRAVVPDRAWISSGNGQTVSVTIGDRVPGYGNVRAIDAENGTIMTTSGRTIKYGRNDY